MVCMGSYSCMAASKTGEKMLIRISGVCLQATSGQSLLSIASCARISLNVEAQWHPPLHPVLLVLLLILPPFIPTICMKMFPTDDSALCYPPEQHECGRKLLNTALIFYILWYRFDQCHQFQRNVYMLVAGVTLLSSTNVVHIYTHWHTHTNLCEWWECLTHT